MAAEDFVLEKMMMRLKNKGTNLIYLKIKSLIGKN